MPEPVIIDFEGNATDLLSETKKVQAALDKTSATVKDSGAAHTVLSQGVKKSTVSWADLSGAVNVAETALRIAGQAYTATVGEAHEYDQQIKGEMRGMIAAKTNREAVNALGGLWCWASDQEAIAFVAKARRIWKTLA